MPQPARVCGVARAARAVRRQPAACGSRQPYRPGGAPPAVQMRVTARPRRGLHHPAGRQAGRQATRQAGTAFLFWLCRHGLIYTPRQSLPRPDRLLVVRRAAHERCGARLGVPAARRGAFGTRRAPLVQALCLAGVLAAPGTAAALGATSHAAALVLRRNHLTAGNWPLGCTQRSSWR